MAGLFLAVDTTVNQCPKRLLVILKPVVKFSMIEPLWRSTWQFMVISSILVYILDVKNDSSITLNSSATCSSTQVRSLTNAKYVARDSHWTLTWRPIKEFTLARNHSHVSFPTAISGSTRSLTFTLTCRLIISMNWKATSTFSGTSLKCLMTRWLAV